MNEIDVISEVANELVLAVEEAMKDLPGTANNMPFVQLLIEYKEMMELFAAQQNAYYRATELWRSKTPGKERTFPDVANLTLFLLEQNDEQASEIEALEAKLATAEGLCDAEVFAVVYSNYDPLEIDSLWATEQLAIDHRERLNDSMWTVVSMTVHSTPYTADEENTDA